MENPVRVLHILQRMEAGGTQALLMNLYRNIDRNKIQFDFFVEYPDKQFYDDEIKSLGGKIYYNTVRKDFNIFKFQKNLKNVIKKNNYKIVHVHAYTIGYFALKASKKCEVPIRIAHSHSAGITLDKNILLKKILQKLYPLYATNLFACSEKAGKYLFKDKKYIVFKNSIPAKKYIFNTEKRNSIKKELNLGNEFIIGHIGRFRTEKNHSFLLDVFYEIKKIKKNSKLLLIGNGELLENIKIKAEKLNILSDIIILSNRNDIDRILSAMDIFIFPSLFEGLSLAALETQAAGTPILCSDALSIEHNITPIFKQLSLNESPQKWAQCAINLADNKLSHSDMSDYIIKSGFDIENNVKKLEEFYLKNYQLFLEGKNEK